MTEDMVFHTNIKADRQQDLINELAGHELAHLWWGTNQIFPDERPGAIMLTETLAMYTEMMLVKRMHGQKRLLENISMHRGLYLDERGYATEHPLYLVGPEERHVGYSKGLLAMYQLSRLIGEERLNLALKNFLVNNAYPNPEPLSTDLLKEIYAVSEPSLHPKLDDLFKKITLYNARINGATIVNAGKGYKLSVEALVEKFYEDGNGKRSAAPFSEPVTLSIEFKDGTVQYIRLPVENGKIKKDIIVDKAPASIEIDPLIELINIADEGERRKIF
jgi:ABC-2 type transport system permease protein